MRKRRSWISLLAFCTLTIVGAALAFAVVMAGASVALAGHEFAERDDEGQQGTVSQNLTPPEKSSDTGSTFNGMITDSHCGARHMRNSQQTSTECARACVRKGATYVLVDGDRRYTLIGDDAAISELAGQRANITGIRQGDAIIVNGASAIF